MNKIIRIASCALLLVFATPSYAAKSGIAIVDAAWIKAMLAGDATAATACYSSDAVLWLTGAPIAIGEKEIKAEYDGYFSAYTVKDVELNELGAKSVGGNSVGWGTFKITAIPKAGGKPVIESGRYTEIAQRLSGKWVYTVDHASDDPVSQEK